MDITVLMIVASAAVILVIVFLLIKQNRVQGKYIQCQKYFYGKLDVLKKFYHIAYQTH